MKKKILIIVGIIIVALFLFTGKEEMRVRVIANSNMTVDQELKKTIVKEITKEIIDLNNLDIIKKKVEYIIQANHYSYSVTIKVEKQEFATKYYQTEVIKGGVYDTLVITIGEGAGDNYWSILYPEYFGVGFDDVSTGNVEYKSWFKQIFGN